ncbi:DUF4279 domain-containing protein [Aeromicrobium fastidiosum]|uniref:DUF4279 domain-containing protein n=1 Tax=Aeromicrobium fastidiosum TaxID=52699 RepID=UPI0020238441|nr:DUF4279 domain-containing protein [Aeromicrobium fastidiosum]MCL8253000.1 DUF4279 domain-containing protein [Aeromicrobium fastidiosum]
MSQYAYFSLRSVETTAAEMASHLGLPPDEVMVLGSIMAEPPRPACHAWKIACRTGGMRVDDQVVEVLDRMRPVAARVRDLVDGGEIVAELIIVRYFDDEDGEEEDVPEPVHEDGHVLEKLPGQHHLLGWALEREYLELVVAMGADIDADEYG